MPSHNYSVTVGSAGGHSHLITVAGGAHTHLGSLAMGGTQAEMNHASIGSSHTLQWISGSNTDGGARNDVGRFAQGSGRTGSGSRRTQGGVAGVTIKSGTHTHTMT